MLRLKYRPLFFIECILMIAMDKREGWIWLDGNWLIWKDAKVHILTHTLHYGMGVFEGVRAYNTKQGTAIFRLGDHTDRLLDSAHILGMKIPYDKNTLNEVQKQALVKNNLKSAYLRPICFYGAEGMGLRADNLKVHTAIAAWDWGSYLGDENMQSGIRVRTSSFNRHHINSTTSKAKANGNYMNSMLALQEALDDGYDEALLLDVDGFVAEGSGENIFIVKGGVLYTPDLTSALAGITRATVVTLAIDLGLQVVEKRITRDEVYVADEAFFTGTAAEVMPIRELDNHNIGNGSIGNITAQLQKLYFDCVYGKNPRYQHWIEGGIVKK